MRSWSNEKRELIGGESLPREKLATRGPTTLSDAELLAVMLGSGGKGRSVTTIAKTLLDSLDSSCTSPSLESLCTVPGIGTAKGAMILAALEFSRRRIRPAGVRISSPSDVLPLISHLSDRKQEHFICISLNGAHEVLATRIITVGLVNCCPVHPREVLSDPITDRAAAIIVAHNHPSGNLDPSPEDAALTQRLLDAGALLGIPLIDHVIFSTRGWFSFKEAGILTSSRREGERIR